MLTDSYAFLPGWSIESASAEADHIRVSGKFLFQPIICPVCGADLKSNGSVRRNYVEAPIRGSKVSMEVDRKRYRCLSGHVFQQELGDCADGKQMTIRALRYIEAESVRSSMNSIAERIGVSSKTVRDISADYFNRLAASRWTVPVYRLEILSVRIAGLSWLLIDRDSGRLLDLISKDEWQTNHVNLLAQSIDIGSLRSIYDPYGALQGLGLGDIEREALPTDPKIMEAITNYEHASGQIGFQAARAQIHLWSDPHLLAKVVGEGFRQRCDCCLSSCRDVELRNIKIVLKKGASNKDVKIYRVCTACEGLRALTWFRPIADFV